MWAQPPSERSVVVTGTFEPVPVEEADRAVRAIPVGVMERLLSANVFDLLRLDPSLDLRARGVAGVQTDLSIRGSTFGQTLVLLNGLRLNDVQTGHHNMNLPVPMEAVSSLEILRGAGSAYYGSDAVGGVVNLITARPEVSEVRLRTSAGNFGVNQQSGALAWARPTFTQQLTFSRDFSTGFRENRDFRNLSLASSTFWRSKLGGSSVLLAHNDRPFGADQFYGNFNSWERTKAWFASLRQDLGERTEVAFGFRRHTDLFVLYRDRPEVFTNRHATETYQLAIRRREPLRRNTAAFNWGLEGYRDGIVSNNLGTHQRDRGAAYAALDFRVLKRFSLTVAGREERYTGGRRQFSPTVAGGVWLNAQLKLRGSLSRAYRLPTYTDLYYRDPANRGNPNLRPESAWTYEGGADWNPHPRWRAEATYFERRERDGIDYVRRSPNEVWQAQNFQRLRFRGAEAALAWRPGPGKTLDVRYTALSGARQALAGGLLSRYAFNYPVHSGVVAWQSEIPKTGLAWRTRIGVLERLGRSPYALWDVYAARVRGAWHPFVQLTNLTATNYQEIAGVAMPGRAVIGGIEWRITAR